jgi:hypothetical protein
VLGGPEDQSSRWIPRGAIEKERVERPQRGTDGYDQTRDPEIRDASVVMELNVTSRDDPNLVLRYKLSMQSFRQAGSRGSSPPCVLAYFLGLAGRPNVNEASSSERPDIRRLSVLRQLNLFNHYRPRLETLGVDSTEYRRPLRPRALSTMPATAMLDPLLLGAMHTDMDTIIVSASNFSSQNYEPANRKTTPRRYRRYRKQLSSV